MLFNQLLTYSKINFEEYHWNKQYQIKEKLWCLQSDSDKSKTQFKSFILRENVQVIYYNNDENILKGYIEARDEFPEIDFIFDFRQIDSILKMKNS